MFTVSGRGVQLIHPFTRRNQIYAETPCTKVDGTTQDAFQQVTHLQSSIHHHQDHVGETRAPGRFLFLGITTVSPDQKRIYRHKRTEFKKSDSIPEPKSKSEPESKPEEESEAIATR